jgi:hypothetical protein
MAADSLDMYLDCPVNGSENADAEGTEAVEEDGRCRDWPTSSRVSREHQNDIQKHDLTCKGIHVVITSAQVYPARIFFDELCDLVDIGERKVVVLEKTPSGGECVFCKHVSLIRFSRRGQNTPLTLYGSLRGGTPSWMSTSKT